MENENKQQKSPHSDSFSLPPQEDVTVPESSPRPSGDHISLSPALGSPGNSLPDSYSSPLHSKQGSGEHISLSPPVGSPARSSFASDHATGNHSHGSPPENEKLPAPEKKPPPVVMRRDVFKEPMENRVVMEEPLAIVSMAVLEEPKADPGHGVAEGGGGGSGRRRFRPSLSILRRAKRDKMVRKAALGFRVFGFLFCLVSLSVMAADRNKGWALDSFDRYKEFRYSMSVNVIGFVYTGAQAVDSSYNLATGKYIVHHQQKLRYYFDFALDQMIAYLLISASSSAAIRVDDWQLNWGKDKFPDFATASISMSFLAFVALASNSLISGYALCTSKSM
ncbi:hypothetical protein CDL12_27721 [Handroanthus impetiginosus]|uniref:CASP-like protein n=1 Tax=Handroanthus impetiginosus TaxID=429701 RepID=A0A2G9G3M1_9LAMI|nr:hypothetical protein CDL12_27721 [Handroanthus impetiginosus]